ncbi:MAG: sensor histidine kinase [Clostridia bacterium]|nr:sensor histidine kinase [Clostridia bacterium]
MERYMKDKKWYRLIGSFIWEKCFSIVLFGIFAGIFAMIFSLYNLEVEAVIYASVLCIALVIVMLPVKFAVYCREHGKRQRILKNIEFDYNNLPEPSTLAEKDYSDMVKALGDINIAHLTENKAKEQDSIDYYTIWVHQIKTPISVMQMILQGEDTEEHRELAAELFRIEQYVGMVLSYLRLGSSSTDFVFKEYEIDSIIKQAVHKYALSFIRKRIKLVYKPVKVTVVTDEKWLLFIVEQLLSNAVKYTNSGIITIEMTDEKVLKISDTGIGIAPEDLPRIFEKGFTGYNGRSDKKSTGLGLYLCKEAAHKLSVEITAQSEPKKGSVFMLRF